PKTGDGSSYGGGLFNAGTLALDSVRVTNNTASTGGGIYNQGLVNITNSTLDDNGVYSGLTHGAAGGAYFGASYSSLSLINSTVSTNHAHGGPEARTGGLVVDVNGTGVIESSTITNNYSSDFTHPTKPAYTGGGLAVYFYPSSGVRADVQLYNTIVAGNFYGA